MVRPAIVRVVLRAVVVDVAENEVVALPVPDAAPDMVNQVSRSSLSTDNQWLR